MQLQLHFTTVAYSSIRALTENQAVYWFSGPFLVTLLPAPMSTASSGGKQKVTEEKSTQKTLKTPLFAQNLSNIALVPDNMEPRLCLNVKKHSCKALNTSNNELNRSCKELSTSINEHSQSCKALSMSNNERKQSCKAQKTSCKAHLSLCKEHLPSNNELNQSSKARSISNNERSQ